MIDLNSSLPLISCLIIFQQAKRLFRSIMPKDEQPQSFHFVFVLATVKMKVKFPCRMAIEHAGHPLTKEVSPSEDGRFIFNQEVRLREETEKVFLELSVCLVTEKGARYVSGLIKLYHNELLRSVGERLVVTLSKCLDPQALCEVQVERVSKQGGQRKRTLTTIHDRNLRVGIKQKEQSNAVGDIRSPFRVDQPLVGNETKSQAHLPVTTNMRLRKQDSQVRSKEYAHMMGQVTSPKKYGNISPQSKNRRVNSKSKYLGFEVNTEQDRDKLIEAEVYRDNYQKLKHKYLRETENCKNELSRRMMLESNENNYKLQIVRLKIRNDELQKCLHEKSMKLKEYANSLATLQSRESDINFMREDLANKHHSMQIMQDTIITLSKENDQIRSTNKEIIFKLQERILILQGEIDTINARSQAKHQELERELKIMSQNLQFKDGQLLRKNQMLEKEKKNIYDLERALQNKLFQYDSLLQGERNNFKHKIDQSKLKIQQLNQMITKLSNDKNDLGGDIDKLKGLLLKSEYQIKLHLQQINNLRMEIDDLRPLRDKYNEAFKELRIITQHKTSIQKSHEKYISSKENAFEQVTAQYKKQIQFQKRNQKELQQRSKILSAKLIQSQGQLQTTKITLQKLKKNHESLNKEYSELKQKEKSLKKGLKMKQQQCDDTKKEVIRLKQKNQTISDSMKSQITKTRQQLAKIKIELQSQIVKNQQLQQSNSQSSMQLARLKMSQQFNQQKYDKLMSSAQQKYSQFQKIIKQHEGVIQLMQQKMKGQKENEKEYYNKLQKCDYQINLVVEKNDKIMKELRNNEERNRQLEFNINSKQNQLNQTLKKLSDLQLKYNDSNEKGAQLKQNLQMTKNEVEKSKKMIEILQRDYEKSKSEAINYSNKLSDRERQLEEKIQESKRDKDTISTLEVKCSSTKKELDKFKDSVTDAISTSFTQIVQSFSLEKQDNSRVSTLGSMDYQSNLASKKALTDLSSDLVSAINMAGKENKTQISKLTDRTKQLQRDLQIIRSQSDRSSQIYKRQYQQKTNYINQLQQQLRNADNDKGQEQIQYQMQITQLQDHLKQYQTQYQNLITIKNQLQFSYASLKIEMDRLSDDYERKINIAKKQRIQYQQKLQYQFRNTEKAQKKAHQLQVELMNINSLLLLQKENSYKKELKSGEVEQEGEKLTKEAEWLRKQLKQFEQKYSQLQIHYLTVNEIKSKYQSMLNEQESKLKEIRSFNNNILKEKQQIIKKQLQKNMEISRLEDKITELTHLIQQEQITKNKYKSDYEQIKQSMKRFSQQIKQMQTTIGYQKNKYNQVRDRLREKQIALNESKQEAASLKKKIEDGRIKDRNVIEQLRQEVEMLTRQAESATLQAGQSIRSLEGQLNKANQQLQTSKEEQGELQELIFVERENNQSLLESLGKLRVELEESRRRGEELEAGWVSAVEETREKEEGMFELGGRVCELEGRLRQAEEEKARELAELGTSLNVRYDEDYQQIYQKVEFMEKEKDYFREKCTQLEQVVARKNEELKHREIEENQMRRASEDKLRRLEEEKLALFAEKNREVARVLEDNKSQFESLRLKDSQIRKITHELQIARSAIMKLEGKMKEMMGEKGNQVKIYQGEIENLRKRELAFKTYKDSVRSSQWNCQREVRKHIQNFIKKVLEIGEKEVRNENVVGLIKGLEQGVLTAVGSISKD